MQVKIHHKLSTITMMLGEGREGITYYDGKYAIKILNPFASKLTLKEEDIDRMKSIKVTALDHPIACAYSLDNMYLGPVSNYIHENGYQNFRTVSSSSFIDIIKQIKEDANVYASYHYLIGDLQLRDSLFDQKRVK